MSNLQPPGPGRRVGQALMLLIAISIGARLITDLLEPVTPFVIGMLILLVLLEWLRSRWR